MLKEIINHKRSEVEKAKKGHPGFDKLEASKNSFKNAIRGKNTLSIIAEIKKASPSRGVISNEFNHPGIAKEYEQAGAACVSVLTDEKFFQGSLKIMREVSKHIALPILRKDFIIDPYQIYEARAYGANAVLLIAKVLDDLSEYQKIAADLNMDVLVEVHNEKELKRALKLNEENLIIGINNRDLDNLKIDMNTVNKLLPLIPDNFVRVAESGYVSFEDLKPLLGKADAVLIGTSIMQSSDKINTIKQLIEPFIV